MKTHNSNNKLVYNLNNLMYGTFNNKLLRFKTKLNMKKKYADF